MFVTFIICLYMDAAIVYDRKISKISYKNELEEHQRLSTGMHLQRRYESYNREENAIYR